MANREEFKAAMFLRMQLVMAMVEARQRYADQPELVAAIVAICARLIRGNSTGL